MEYELGVQLQRSVRESPVKLFPPSFRRLAETARGYAGPLAHLLPETAWGYFQNLQKSTFIRCSRRVWLTFGRRSPAEGLLSILKP